MERLKNIISGLHPETELRGDERLIEDGILDSLDIVTLVTDINEKFGISIGAEDVVVENFNKISDIAALITRRGGDIECN
ncbi:MAG: acyl carrier protein [Clostridia bacterium]|nr:acyl carrier protein [Clostridia bacterium]